MNEPKRPDIAGAVGCVLAIALGAAAWWAARDFSPLGSVFPRTVGALLIALGVLYLVFVALGRTKRAAALEGANVRRAGLAAVMLGWGFALGPLGFLPSSAVAMALLLVIAHHGRWTPRVVLLHGGSVGFVLIGLYALFKLALQVPLP